MKISETVLAFSLVAVAAIILILVNDRTRSLVTGENEVAKTLDRKVSERYSGDSDFIVLLKNSADKAVAEEWSVAEWEEKVGKPQLVEPNGDSVVIVYMEGENYFVHGVAEYISGVEVKIDAGKTSGYEWIKQ